jgi:hypothetical protein
VNALTVKAFVTHATAAPGKRDRRANPDDVRTWSDHFVAIRSCQHCKTVYVTAGDAQVCEHFHEGL